MATPDRTFEFKDLTVLTRWTKGLLYADLVLAVIGIVSSIAEYRLLSAMNSGAFESGAAVIEAADANDFRQMVIGSLQLAMFVALCVVVLMWIYRANNNAHALGAKSMRFTPGWAIGWYLVPIANLWMPYKAMKEIWQASADPQHWQVQQRSPLLPWWWFFWIASAIIGRIGVRLALKAEELDELMQANLFGIVLDATTIPLNLILIAIISQISRMQMEHHANRTIGEQPKAPSVD